MERVSERGSKREVVRDEVNKRERIGKRKACRQENVRLEWQKETDGK